MKNIFQYLYDKKGKQIPLKYKLLYNLPLNENELIVNTHLNLSCTNISSLPNNLTVNGSLDLDYTKINSLPDNLTVNSNLWCMYTPLADNIKKDPSLLTKYSKQIKGEI